MRDQQQQDSISSNITVLAQLNPTPNFQKLASNSSNQASKPKLKPGFRADTRLGNYFQEKFQSNRDSGSQNQNQFKQFLTFLGHFRRKSITFSFQSL